METKDYGYNVYGRENAEKFPEIPEWIPEDAFSGSPVKWDNEFSVPEEYAQATEKWMEECPEIESWGDNWNV